MGNNMKITELDRYLFGQGTHYEIYKLLGVRRGRKRVFSLLYGRLMQRLYLL